MGVPIGVNFVVVLVVKRAKQSVPSKKLVKNKKGIRII